jgi:hypothetical protein
LPRDTETEREREREKEREGERKRDKELSAKEGLFLARQFFDLDFFEKNNLN